MGKLTDFANWAEKAAKGVKDAFKTTDFKGVLQDHPTKMQELMDEAKSYAGDWRHMIIAAAAKLCKADGTVTKAEIAETEEALKFLEFTGSDRKAAIQLFTVAKDAPLTFAETIIAFKDFCPDDLDATPIVILLLFRIAHADGHLSTAGRECLEDACRILGASFDGCLQFYLDDRKSTVSAHEAYTILGCDPAATTETIKERYRALVKEFHPDTIASKQLHGEFNQFAEEKFKKIQAAYESIMQQRASDNA